MKNKRPSEFPEHIQKRVTQCMPNGYKLWWIRGKVIGVEHVRAPSYWRKELDTRIVVQDLDDPTHGYDVRLLGTSSTVEPEEFVSLLGHERTDSQTIGHPRYLLQHSRSLCYTAWPYAFDRDDEKPTLEDEKNWLCCYARVKADFVDRLMKALPFPGIAGLAMFGLHEVFLPKNYFKDHPLALVAFVAALVAIFVLIFWRSKFITRWVGLEWLYKDICNYLKTFIEQNHPYNTEVGLVSDVRQLKTQRRL